MATFSWVITSGAVFQRLPGVQPMRTGFIYKLRSIFDRDGVTRIQPAAVSLRGERRAVFLPSTKRLRL